MRRETDREICGVQLYLPFFLSNISNSSIKIFSIDLIYKYIGSIKNVCDSEDFSLLNSI